MSLRHFRVRRTQTGSGIVEGVVGLGIVIGATVLAVLLIINVGTATHLKRRVGFMAEQAAQYAANEDDDSKRSEFVRELSTKMGLGQLTKSKFADLEVLEHPAVRATLTSRMSTFGDVAWLPASVRMSDSAVCTAGGAEMEGYCELPYQDSQPGMPLVNRDHLAWPVVKITQKKPTYTLYARDWDKGAMHRIVR